MKLLMIGPFPPVTNGVTVSNDFLYRQLIAKGEQVSVINTETGKIASKQGDKLSIVKITTFASIYVHLFKVIGKSVVYMTIGQTFWGLTKYSPFILLCKILGIPYVLHIHGGYICKAYSPMKPYKRRIFKWLLQGSRTVIALSKSLAHEIKITFPKTHVEVVENFYDPRLIEDPIIRNKNTKPHFLFLSNLMLGKGILEFLDALLVLKNDYKQDFEVSIAGNIEKGIEEVLQQKISVLKDHVMFFGHADFEKKKQLLYQADFFVLPTWYIMEGQPLSIIEAYVTGNVVISTHQGGIKDISNYETFYKVESKNPEKLSELLADFCIKRQDFTQELLKTKSDTIQRFSPERFFKEINSILYN